MQTLGTDHAALVGSGTESIVAGIDGGAAIEQCHGLGRAAVVRKCAEQGIAGQVIDVRAIDAVQVILDQRVLRVDSGAVAKRA